MKKSKADNTSVFDAHRQNFVGKVYTLSRCQVVVEDVIAEGGFALVFAVKSVRSDDRFALKRLCVNNEQDLAVARREIQIARTLSGHKNIVSYIDSNVSKLNADVYEVLLLMQYCQGRLISLMAERQPLGGLSEKDILRVFCDVCEAISQFHHRQPPIIHRDIKAENVLISSSGHYVLCDFGSAAGVTHTKVNIQQLQEEIARYTTVSYRSPEMVDLYSGKTISTKADIWALGCFLYRLCFSTLPFGDSMLAIQSGAYTIPDSSPYSRQIRALIGYMLEIDCDIRPDIYQVSALAFHLAHKSCPVLNAHHASVPDISSLPLPLTESEAKQTNVRQTSSRKGTGMVADIESTSVKPRQRPRPADATLRPPQPLGAAVVGISDPPAVTSSSVVGDTAASANANKHLLPHEQVQSRQQVPQKPQEPLLLLSDQPGWTVDQWTVDQQPVEPPHSDNNTSSLIDLDPESTLLTSLDPLASIPPAAFPTAYSTGHHHFRPSFRYDVPTFDPFMASAVGYHNQPSGQPVTSLCPSGMVPPRHCTTHSMHGCAQQAVRPFSQSLPHSSLRMMMPQYCGVTAQPKTGSNNDLHLLQSDGDLAGQRYLVTKHRRIVSDTSALQLPMPLIPHQPQQQAALMPSMISSHDGAPLKKTVQQPIAVTLHPSELNPFANDNFGSLSAEDIIAQQFDQLQMSNKHMTCSAGDLSAAFSQSAATGNSTKLNVASQPLSVNPLSSLSWR